MIGLTAERPEINCSDRAHSDRCARDTSHVNCRRIIKVDAVLSRIASGLCDRGQIDIELAYIGVSARNVDAVAIRGVGLLPTKDRPRRE